MIHSVKADKVCDGFPEIIYEQGLGACKAGQELHFLANLSEASIRRAKDYVLAICRLGTIEVVHSTKEKFKGRCILKAERNFTREEDFIFWESDE